MCLDAIFILQFDYMDYSEYREQEVEISNKLNQWFETFCANHPEYSSIKSIYCSKKVHFNGIQFVAGFSSKNIGSVQWQNYIAVPILIELVMLWAYKTNRILDHKQEVWKTEEGIKDTLLEHDLLLSCIFQILEESKSNLEDKYETVHFYIINFIKDLPVGFLIEKEKLNFNHSSVATIQVNWEQNYTLRNIKFNSLYDFAPLIGYYVATGIDIIPNHLENIPENMRFSHVGQIINDLWSLVKISLNLEWQ